MSEEKLLRKIESAEGERMTQQQLEAIVEVVRHGTMAGLERVAQKIEGAIRREATIAALEALPCEDVGIQNMQECAEAEHIRKLYCPRCRALAEARKESAE